MERPQERNDSRNTHKGNYDLQQKVIQRQGDVDEVFAEEELVSTEVVSSKNVVDNSDEESPTRGAGTLHNAPHEESDGKEGEQRMITQVAQKQQEKDDEESMDE